MYRYLWIVPLTLALGVQGRAATPSVTLALQATSITLHEPLFVTATFRNYDDTPVTIDRGYNDVLNFKMALRKPDGTIVSVDPRPSPLGDVAVHTKGITTVPPRQLVSTQILLDEWFDLDQPGQYRLAVHFTGSPSLTIDGRDQQIALTVLPRDEQALRALCERLTQAVLHVTSVASLDTNWNAARTLTFIKDPIVVEYLLRIINSRRTIVGKTVTGNNSMPFGPEQNAAIDRLDTLGEYNALRDALTTIEDPLERQTIDDHLQRMEREHRNTH